MRLSDSIGQAGRLLGNLGVSDKSTNFMLEQRSLLRAQEREGRDVRNLIDSNVSKTFLFDTCDRSLMD
jgi:hypothetical protein